MGAVISRVIDRVLVAGVVMVMRSVEVKVCVLVAVAVMGDGVKVTEIVLMRETRSVRVITEGAVMVTLLVLEIVTLTVDVTGTVMLTLTDDTKVVTDKITVLAV